MANALAGFNLYDRVSSMYPGQTPQAPMADPESVAAARQSLLARNQAASRPGYAISGQMYAANQAGLPPELLTGDRKIDDLTRTGLMQGVPYEELARNAGIALDYSTRPMSEGGGAEPEPGFLDLILPTAMGLAAGGVGALNGLGALGSSVLGATTSGLFGQGTAPLPLVGAGMGVVGAGATNALGQLKNSIGNSGGFSNTNLGLKGENLALPGLSNAPNYVPPTAGVGPGALGFVDSLGRATANIPGLALNNLPKPPGTNPYPMGGLTPDMLYNPVSMGGPGAKPSLPSPGLPDIGPSGSAGGATGGAMADAAQGPQVGSPSLSGPTDATQSPQFSATLTDGMGGGKGPANSLMGTGMGAGLIAPGARDMYRNPGYQPRPFGNYLLLA